jgi:hypothetical protein
MLMVNLPRADCPRVPPKDAVLTTKSKPKPAITYSRVMQPTGQSKMGHLPHAHETVEEENNEL